MEQQKQQLISDTGFQTYVQYIIYHLQLFQLYGMNKSYKIYTYDV